LKAYLVGVRFKRDTDVKLCASQKDAEQLRCQILYKYVQDIEEEDVEIIKVPCPSLFKMLISYLKQAWR
jgi:hypothetical protein